MSFNKLHKKINEKEKEDFKIEMKKFIETIDDLNTSILQGEEIDFRKFSIRDRNLIRGHLDKLARELNKKYA